MKVKDLERTANIAWSPANVSPIYLAAGTAGQQLDASFETNASLEIFALNLNEPGAEMELKAGVPSEHRFHKLAWSSHGSEAGTLVGGCDGGALQIYNASKLLHGEPAALAGKQEKHSGAVHSLDFNPFQSYLLASGAASSEIFIWDLNNLSSPMTPGTKSQPYEDVLSIQWNRQVQHILASTFASKCVVWDLRKNETIIKLTDTVSRIRWKVVAWHPEVATQLCLASEEDQAPIIQLWDLRFATSPLKTLENHQRGVLSMAWCAQDPDLLVTGGKDNRVICWNANSNQQGGEVLSEVARTNQWNFDIAWCPKNPALIASPSYDGHVSVYSLLGGKAQQIQTTNKIADSFPGMDAGDYVQAPLPQAPTAAVSVDLSKAPKWLKKPVAATFGFGGKLITFDHDKTAVSQQQQQQVNGQVPHISRQVYISQVVTETDFVKRSTELEQALEYGNFTDYCRNKADASQDQHTRYVWHFLKANFEPNPRTELLNLLGYKIEDVNARLSQHVPPPAPQQNDNMFGLNQQFAANRIDSEDAFAEVQQAYDAQSAATTTPEQPPSPYKIKTGNDSDGLIAQALLMNNVEAAAALCMEAKRYADALIIATAGGAELLNRMQSKYLSQCNGYVSSLISALVTGKWTSVVANCDVESWREALAAALTHADDEGLPLLCEMMGNRLSNENDPKLRQDAQLCYICAGSFGDLVNSWCTKAQRSNDDLLDLVELVTFLQKAVERQGRRVEVSGVWAQLLSKYAMLLASQGSLNTALAYLGSSTNDPQVASLKERLYIALGHKPAYGQVHNRSRHNTARSSVSSTYLASAAPPPAVPVVKQFNTGLPNANPPTSWNQPTTTQPTWQTQPLNQPAAAGVPWQPTPTPVPAAAAPPMQPMQWNATPAAPPPAAQPPRPGSVGPSGLPKNKYVVDPSVQSGGYGAPPLRSNSNYGAMPFMPSPAPTPGGMPTASTPQVSMFTPTPNSFTAPPNVGAFNAPPTMTPMAPITPMVPMATDMQTPGMPPGGMQLPSAMNTLPPNAAPGWNDPPVLNKHAKPQPPKSDAVSHGPITHPIFGTTPARQNPANGFMDPNMPQQHYPPADDGSTYLSRIPLQPLDAMYLPQMHQHQPRPQTTGAPPAFHFNRQAVPAGTEAAAESLPPTPAEPTPKLPIPEEHIHMQTVFDELRVQCGRATQNPQTRRKIEDVARKLETLYDLLREHKLSSNTLSGLHQIVQCIQHGDYSGGLGKHTEMVSGPDFAQIAGFMPGIKVLMQCAIQLQVYLR